MMKINRKYNVDENFFNNIDTENKAYWLGFLWADGNITKTTKRSSGPNRLRISQQYSDLNHIEKLKKDIKSEHNITRTKDNMAQLDINSRAICKSLEKLGFSLKNERVDIPKIDESLIRHFIRGYFDGDGSFSIYKQKICQNNKNYILNKFEFSITGRRQFVLKIRKVLEDNNIVTKNLAIKTYKNRAFETITIKYGKHQDILNLYKYLYKDSTIYLERKYLKFLEFLSYINSGC